MALLWVGCVAGALEESEYAGKLKAAGFTSSDIEPTRIYRIDDAWAFLTAKGIDAEKIAPQVDGKFASAFIRAVKPGAEKALLWPNLLPLGVQTVGVLLRCFVATDVSRAILGARSSIVTSFPHNSVTGQYASIEQSGCGDQGCLYKEFLGNGLEDSSTRFHCAAI